MAEPGTVPGIGPLLAAYAEGSRTPAAVLRDLYASLARRSNDHVWIHVLPVDDALRQLEGVEARHRAGAPLPLFGVPSPRFATRGRVSTCAGLSRTR